MKKKIIVISESKGSGEDLLRLLGRLGGETARVLSLSEAVRLLGDLKGPAILVSNLASLGRDALQELGRLKKERPALSVIALARVRNSGAGIALLNRGLVDHFVVPEDRLGLFSAVRSELIKTSLSEDKDRALRNIRRLKAERLKSLKGAAEAEKIYDSTLENLMAALDLRDVETFGHSQTVAKYSQVLAKLLGLGDEAFLDNLRKGALLHDIGKIAIPDIILKKPGSLSADEWKKIRLHPTLGYGLIKEIKLVKEVGNVILYHHERWDGKGYPYGLRENEIPLEARIFALADALDAITAYRPYRNTRDYSAARKEISENAGTQFDPLIVQAFCSLKPEKWERIRLETTSSIPSIGEFSALVRKVTD
jgi:putative nucleotidyltransferase with HDIG domain